MPGVGRGVNWSALSADPPFLCADVRALSLSQAFYDQARAQPGPEPIDRQSEPEAVDRQAVWRTAAWR